MKQQESQGLKSGKAAIRVKNDVRRARRIACHQQDQPDPWPASAFIHVSVAAEIAKLRLASTATQGVVPKQTLMVLPHSRNHLMDINHSNTCSTATTIIGKIFGHKKSLFETFSNQSETKTKSELICTKFLES